MKTATIIKRQGNPNTNGDQVIAKCDPPMCGRHYYVCSRAISRAFDTGQAETYLFPCDEAGDITDWGELPGSFQGEMNHEQAFQNAGYTLIEGGDQ